jgi:uncharacterized membrane protein YsdA (DUF1294 family)
MHIWLRRALVIISLAVLAWLIITSQQSLLMTKIYVVISTVAFVAYAIDKAAAKGNRWRIPESTLHALGLVGGWPGALLAQTLLRHKSVKREFRLIFWITVAINLFVLGWLLSRWQ